MSTTDETPRRIQALLDKGWLEHDIRDALDTDHELGPLHDCTNPPGALLHRLRNIDHERYAVRPPPTPPPNPYQRPKRFETTTPAQAEQHERLAEAIAAIAGPPAPFPQNLTRTYRTKTRKPPTAMQTAIEAMHAERAQT